jgi:two-component system chemotaxis response regulator CheY
MRSLVAEDDFTSRKLMQRFLAAHGECDAATDGAEAVDAFQAALEEGEKYDVVCLDIMMPKKDGQTVLKEIRQIEEANDIHGLDCVKVIMTTALSDSKNVMEAFRSQSDAYIEKPVDKKKLVKELQALGLVD